MIMVLAAVAMGLMLIGCSDTSDPGSGSTTPSVPGVPTGLVSLTHTETSIAIAWNAVSGAARYRVYAGTVAGSLTRRGSPTSTSYLIEGLSANTTYYIEVSAENEAGEGNKSTAITVTTNQGVKPASPAGLTIGTITETSIAITWNSVTGASSYKVFAGTTDAEMTLRGSPTTTSFTITGLVANTTYYVAVSTRTASSESDQCTPVSTVTVPAAPAGLAAGTITSNSIAITWNSITGVSGYTVYAGTASGSLTQQGTPTTASFTLTGLTANTTYYIAVSAKNASGEGTQSSSITITTQPLAQTKNITQFRFADFAVNGTINGTNITVMVPNIVNLTTLAPTITHNGKSISPASDVPQNFSSPVQYTVTAEDNTAQNYTVTVSVTNTSLATAFAWIRSYSGSTRTFTIVAQSNESLAVTAARIGVSGSNIILSGGTTEKTISLSSNGSFSIYGEVTLDNNITLQGHSSNNASLVQVWANANLVMNTGSKIINNTVIDNLTVYGGGVYITAGGTFTMNGGTISGNRVEATSSSSSYDSTIRAKGGGVYVSYGGTFIMNNGTISGNTAYSEKYAVGGGGVFVDGGGTNTTGGTFTLVNGTISNNTADSRAVMANSYAYGGGVAVWGESGTFTMQGGTISGNQAVSSTGILATSYYYGGGVYLELSNFKFRKTGGIIYGSNGTTAQQNLAKDRTSSSIGTTSGHAVYAGGLSKLRNTTAGTAVSLDSSKSGSAGGWE